MLPVSMIDGSKQQRDIKKSTRNKYRRRIPTIAQRIAANIRERQRMHQLNCAFDYLRNHLPTFSYEKSLSRIETLRLAIEYIRYMSQLLIDQVKNTS